MFPVLFQLPWGNFNAYGALILLGGLLAFPGVWWDVRTRGLRERAASFTVDFFLIVIVGAFVGGRLLHLITAPETYQGAWWRAFSLESTGFVFFGSLLAIIAGWSWLARRYELPFATICDVGATFMPLGHAFGRLGCFAAGCCWGAPTTVAGGGDFGVRFPADAVVYAHEPHLRSGELTLALHPVQLYEACGLLLIFAWLFSRRHRRIDPPLRQASRYAIAYGVLRTVTEIFRADDVRGLLVRLEAPPLTSLLGLPQDQPILLSVSQLVALTFVLIGIWGYRRTRGSTQGVPQRKQDLS